MAQTISDRLEATGLLAGLRGAGCILIVLLIWVGTDARADNGMRTPVSPSSDACLPVEMPSRDVFFAAPKKVFAHYFNRFPLSIDNSDASVDYYATQYLKPSGEGNKWLAHGGFLRARPLPVQVGRASEYVIENLKAEVRLALSRGITGFTFDILTLDDINPGSYLSNMLAAAAAVDPRFQIVLMPDIAALGPDTGKVAKIVKDLYKQPGLFRFPDGSLVIAPFLSEAISPEAWQTLKSELARDGFKITFIPTFLSIKYLVQYSSVAEGFGTFGTPIPRERYAIVAGALIARGQQKPFMAGISSQGYRPKEYRYWEAQGSLAYRDSWLGAIDGAAEWIQLTTWNDFSESTQVLPFTDAAGSSGTGYFNLTGYYATWFATGKVPVITHDVLYYFYRRHAIRAKAVNAGKQVWNAVRSSPGKDIIELLGFLTSPGTLAVSIGGRRYTKQVGAGLQSFSVPLDVGTPVFSLLRGNDVAISFEGKTAIVGASDLPNGHADLTYWSGSASAKGTCFSDAIRW